MRVPLCSAAAARELDREASAAWGLSADALVEAAGRLCAHRLVEFYRGTIFPEPAARGGGFSGETRFPKILVLAGGGNNGADALVLLRALILGGHAAPGAARVLLSQVPPPGEEGPRAAALRSLLMLEVPVAPWEGALPPGCSWDLLIDGIAGTGIDGPLGGTAREMAGALNDLRPSRIAPARRGEGPPVVSIDLPSGNFDGWEPGMPLVEADLTLGIEPLKLCLYAPPARFAAGTILPVGGLFPPALMESYRGAELLDWKAAAALIPPVRADAHKYRRGVVEIHAGSPGAAGAARIAARGAQAAGAGIVRLLLDRELYPLLAPEAGGIMVVPRGPLPPGEGDRFRPSALLLGPGWGQDPSRQEILEWALEREAAGIPLILDADALRLAKDRVFHGNAILTPHPGEFAVLAGLPPPELPPQPGPLLLKIAREKQAVIVYKSSVIFVAAPDGRLACLDGMEPALAAGGSGDLLAGFCAALAGRMGRARWNGSAPDPAPADQSPPGQTVPGGQGGAGEAGLDQPASAPPVRAVPINQPSSGQTAPGGDAGDGYSCALAAAALLLESLRRGGLTKKFIDPLELAARAAETAGAAWL